jgi:hypothetical protein
MPPEHKKQSFVNFLFSGTLGKCFFMCRFVCNWACLEPSSEALLFHVFCGNSVICTFQGQEMTRALSLLCSVSEGPFRVGKWQICKGLTVSPFSLVVSQAASLSLAPSSISGTGPFISSWGFVGK